MHLTRHAAAAGAFLLALSAAAACESPTPPQTVASSTGRGATPTGANPTTSTSASTSPTAAVNSSLPSTTDPGDTVAVPLTDQVSMMVNARVRSEGNRDDVGPGVTVVAAEGQTVVGVSYAFVLNPPGNVTFDATWGAEGDLAVLAPPDEVAAAGLPCQPDPLNPTWCRLGPFAVSPQTGFDGVTIPYGAGIEEALAVPRTLDLHAVRVAFETIDGRSIGVPTRYADPGQG